MRLELAVFGFACLFCALFNEKGNIPLPLLALIMTIASSGMIQVSLAVMTLIIPLLRSSTVRSLLLWGVMALIAVSIRNTRMSTITYDGLPAISSDASPDASSSSLTLYDGYPSPSTYTAQCIDEPSLDHEINYGILDYDAFLDASNRKARDLVEWVVDERSEDWRKRLLMWHRHMATLASTLNPSLPAMTEFMERWQDVSRYLQALPNSPDPMDIYQKVWRTVRSFHIVKRDMKKLGLD